MATSAHQTRGFTLIEMIMVIVLTGIVASIVAVFIKSPVDAYVDMARRAELADVADTAVRRLARDIHLAVPNSVRNPAGIDQCIEFIPTKAGGRYRAAQTSALTGDILDFTTADSSFDMLGLNSSLPASERIAVNDIVVVYNDGSSSGSAYLGSNAIQIAAVGAGDTAGTTKLDLVGPGAAVFAGKTLPAASPASRFQVIPATEHVVAYRCSGSTLTRHSRLISSPWALPADCTAMTSGATTATLATNVSACSMKYEAPGSGTGAGAGRYGIVSISLAITQAGESVNLYHQATIDNTP